MAQTHQLLDFEPWLKPPKIGLWAMAQKNFRAMAQTLIFGGFEPWLKPTFDMQILTAIMNKELKSFV